MSPRQPVTDVCATKLGDTPEGMYECGAPCEYIEGDGTFISGWRHIDTTLDRDHWPVPSRAVR